VILTISSFCPQLKIKKQKYKKLLRYNKQAPAVFFSLTWTSKQPVHNAKQLRISKIALSYSPLPPNPIITFSPNMI